jgi:hypothetical protein
MKSDYISYNEMCRKTRVSNVVVGCLPSSMITHESYGVVAVILS